MSLTDRISALTPEQRALFEKLRAKQRKAASAPQAPPIRRVTGPTAEGDWPLSLDQERYWFMEQLYPEGAGLNITAATRMRGPLAPDLVAAALDEIARRHAAWRTVFPAVDGRPVQRVLPSGPQRLQIIDLTALPAARREAEALRLVGEDSATPFDLELGPLVRSRLVRLSGEEHVCLLTIHHLVTDFISSHIAWSELAVLYNALAVGGRPALPEPPVQYPDFAVWQREWLQGEALDELSSWWRERLEGFPRALDLPSDRPRPAELRMRGGRLTFRVDGELADGLRALARQEGATLFMVVLALTAAVLHRDSGEERLVLGANNANRSRPEIQPVLGCFLTQVPFPIDLGGEPTFRELLARVRQSALGAYAHQDLPFGQLVQAIRLERDPSRPPLVQTLVQVLDGQPAATTLAGASFEVVDAWDGRARYDLMLTLFEVAGGGLDGALEYDADLFDPATSARRIERLLLQAAAVVADPDLPLPALPVLPGVARHQALAEWNDTARPAAGWTAPRRFAERAARAPEALAVAAGGEALSYAELDRRSTALARRLRALGVEPESRVALLLDRTVDVPVAILGVWKAGGAYVPLDPGSPTERLADLLADCEPAVVVHRGPLAVALSIPLAEGTPALNLDLDLDLAPEVGDGPLPEARPEHLAYLIYTSGTTGRPKAVMAEHRGLATTLESVLGLLGLGPGDRVPHLSRYTFDASLLEIVAPLVTGGAVEILERDEILDPERLLAVFARSTVAFTVPALLRRAAAGARERGLGAFAGLRGISIGGDVVPPDLQAEVLAAFPSTEAHVVYGPTETTIICTAQTLSRRRPLDRALIGRPLPEVEARVVDGRGEPVPLGLPGELWIGGPGVARGYFRREELTTERFVEADGRRFYRTGDLVRQVPAEGGALEFLGRTDLQVKIRGFRVEPGEVEAALLAHPAVRDTVVVARPGAGGESQLVAYVVGGEGEDLRAFLRGRLPEHMVPALFVPLEALPVGPTGKVDRKALPAPRPAGREAAGPALPRDPREERLAEIWRAVLGLERVGVHDNFFELGGDSILGIQVVARARREGLLLTPRQLFEHQTIAGLAAVAGGVEGPGDDQGPVTGEAPLTPIQRLFFAQERRRPAHFNQAVALVPRERLDAPRLAAALARLAAHHDALRSRFFQEGDGWKQVHAPAAPAPLLEADLTAAPAAFGEAMEELQDGLDLARGPLLTAALFRRGDEDRLLLTAHHLVVDGVSWRVLLEDLEAAYQGRELPPKTTSWKRWAELLAGYARSAEVEAELPYWRDLPVPPPLPRDLDGVSGAATLAVELGAGETRALLQEAPEAYRTQVNDLLLAALARAFAAWTGEGALRVGLEGHGREELSLGVSNVDLSRTVGWFTTLYPVVLALPPGGPGEAIRTVKETLRSVPGRGLGYGLLRDRLPAEPAPEVTFNYLGRFDQAAGESGLFAFAPEAPKGALGEAVADRPRLQIDALVLGDQLRVSWTYDPGRHLPATVERLARGFLVELTALVEHCLSPEAGGFTPSDFPLAGLDQGALDRLVGADRGVEDLYPLAPMQEGMLFHSLYAGGADVYFEQFTAEIEGDLDEEAFAAAWRRVVERHTALRTGFVWHGVERPLQLVRRSVEIPWTAEDWRTSPSLELDARWRAFLEADRARGFDLARPPLLRLALARVGEARRRLAWSTHHILFDGWCFPLLLNEVFTLYGAAVSGRPAALPAPRPFRDYIEWLGRRDPAEAEAFWRQRLEGLTAPTPVPFDRPDRLAAGQAARPEEYFDRAVVLPARSSASLEALAQRLRVTLNTLVQGAWALLLARYGETSDVTFGAVVSGRPAELPGVESMVGLFINTVPVRVEVPESGAASAWLARLQADQADLRQHEWTPLATIQKLAGLAAGEALFATLLVFENYPMDPELAGRLGDLRITGAGLAERTNYPFTLTVTAQGGIGFRLTADPRCEPATAVRMLGHLEALLADLAADPEAPPAARPLLAPAERHQLTAEWNDTAPSRPTAATIPALFAAQAARAPGAVAVVCGDEEITYAELDRRARRVAGRLLRAGVAPETRVAVPAVRSASLIPTLLGILQAGCAYLPVDPELPEERRRFMLADAGAVVLDLEEGDEAVDLPGISPGQLAYVIYTSGSTGTPKGVAVTHANIAARVTSVEWVELGPGETLLQVVNVAFDVSTLEIWGPLLNGGRLAVLPGRRPDLAELEGAVRRHGVTTLWLTAGLFHQMIDERPQGLRPLRQLLAGGDALSPAHVRRALAELPGCALINGYGPTESTIFITTHRMTAADLADDRLAATVPIGRPLPATSVHVLDAALRPVPAAVWGELCSGGEGVARGYLGRPDLTAERFVPDPFSTTPGGRLYRTGDVVRRRPDGVIEFLGRRDGQVKIRGIRIELGEIEAALARHPQVRAALVIPWEMGGDRRLAAYVVADPAGAPDADALRRHLAVSLPEAMIPSAFVILDRLPLTVTGKVDRRALPPPDPAARRTREYLAPSNPVEESLAEACAEVLGIARVGMRDNFFELGGHSLLATRLVTRLQDRHGLEVTLQMVFDAADLLGLADRIIDAGLDEAEDLSPEELEALLAGEEDEPPPRTPARAAAGPPAIRPAPREEGGMPLSFAQERLWFLDRLRPGNAAYNMFEALDVRGDLSPALLAAVVGEIARRHEALRTTFREAAGHPAQVVAPPSRWTVPVVDLAGLPDGSRQAEARRLAAAQAGRPFDLARGPLLRVLLVRLAAAGHALFLTMHHIVSDGWSLGVVVRELTALYAAARAGRPSPLPELPIQYADFAVWQRRWLAGGELERQLDYWRRRLDGAPAGLALPLDRPRPALPDPRGAVVISHLDAGVAAGLSRLARRHEATLFMVLLAAFQTLLLRLTGQEDLTVGSPIANRNRAEIEPLIGFFVNMLVLRGELADDPTFAGLLAETRRTTLEAYDHQDLPFERLVEELRPERRQAANPLFQVSCSLQNAPTGALELSGLSLSRLDMAVVAARFDLELYAWQEGGGVAAALVYAARLFDPATVHRLMGHLERLLAAVVEDPSRRLSALPLLAVAERHQLLREWSGEEAAGGDLRGIVERVAEAARRDPGATAVASPGERLTYAGLADRAGRLARRLTALGVGPGVPVGLHAGRSPEMVTGALGVLAAGGAYVPLDPGQPASRLAHLVAATRMPVVLTLESAPAWAGDAAVARLDEEAAEDGAGLPLPPMPPGSAAYVIHTSGSTGRPKGVEIPHAGLLNLVRWHLRTYGVTAADRATLIASPGFDAAVWEVWPYLVAGASLHVPDEEVRLSPERLTEWLIAEEITLCFLPTPLAEQLLAAWEVAGAPRELRLRALLTGGDRLSRRPPPGLPFDVVNHYGPTECSVVATAGRVEPAPGARSPFPPAIGRPVAGVRARLLDARLQPVPAGGRGEVLLGGAGLARGYLGRPDLTAERFVPDPFAGAPGERLYRTGDLARFRPDGELDFLGRIDTQVKLRGFRIEPGEIESALCRHPQVREAVVTLREGRLVAYVVPRDPSAQVPVDEDDAGHVAQWRTLYDETYGRRPAEEDTDPIFDIRGWNSSYTGGPIPAVEMREWVDATVERLLALPHRRVLEVGCGTGLLLFRVAPSAERYRATDFSGLALARVRAGLDVRPLPQVELAQAQADDWSAARPGEFDLVVLNSIVQYFPGVDYLIRVLAGAVAAVAPGGAVFVGDVRSLPLLEAFHTSVELHRTPGPLPAGELERRVRRRVEDEEELVIDPQLFHALARWLPGVRRVQVLPKSGRHANELTRFRYDVILGVGDAEDGAAGPASRDEPRWSAWANDPLRATRARRLPPELRRFLEGELPEPMVPAAFVVLDALPLGASGKVDRAALPAPERPVEAEEWVPPATPLEEELARAVAEVLGVERVGLRDNFFALGGHSLLATQLVSRLTQEHGMPVTLPMVFDAADLGDLADRIVERELAAAGDGVLDEVLRELEGEESR